MLNGKTLLIVIVLVLTLAFGCTQTKPKAAPRGGNTIIIKDYAFDPADIVINKGETVTWENMGNEPHDVTGSGIESKPLANAENFKYTFYKSGKYSYKCSLHPEMKGTITVK